MAGRIVAVAHRNPVLWNPLAGPRCSDCVPLAFCVGSQATAVGLPPAGSASSIHTVSPAGIVGAGACAAVHPLPLSPTWSPHPSPSYISMLKPMMLRWIKPKSTAGISTRTHCPLVGTGPIDRIVVDSLPCNASPHQACFDPPASDEYQPMVISRGRA